MAPSTKTPQDNDSVVRDLTSQPRAYLVQAGWHVHDHVGELIGEVVDREVESVVVSIADGEGERVRIPARLIAEEEDTSQRATLAVEADDLESLRARRHHG